MEPGYRSCISRGRFNEEFSNLGRKNHYEANELSGAKPLEDLYNYNILLLFKDGGPDEMDIHSRERVRAIVTGLKDFAK